MRDFRLMTIIGAVMFVAVGASTPLMTLFLSDLGISFGQISLILTTFMVAALASNYTSGYLSDRLQRRKPLLIGGLWLMAVAYVVLSRVPSGSAVWLVRIVEGIGSGAYGTLSLAMMGDLLAASPRRGREMGFYRGIGSLAFAIGAVTGGWLVSQASIPTVFLFSATAYLAAGAIALWVHEPRPATAAGEQSSTAVVDAALEPVDTPVRSLPRVFLAGVYLWILAMSGVATMWPNFMKSLGYAPQTVSNLWGLAALIEMPGMQLAGILSDSIGRAPLLAAGALGMAVVFTSYIFFAQWLIALVGIQIVRGLAFGSYTASAMTFAAEHASRRTRGSVSGVFTAVTSAGFLSGTLVSGFVAQTVGFNALFVAAALTATGSAGCFVVLWRRQAKAGQEQLRHHKL